MIEQTVSVERLEQIVALFGSFDKNIKDIEARCGVTIVYRDSDIKISGDAERVYEATQVINGLLAQLARGEAITDQSLHYVIDLVREGKGEDLIAMSEDVICITAKGRPLKPKTLGQTHYIESLRKNTVTFCIGPAGTGKTYLAVAMAVRAFRAHQVNRIILTRPAVEAGEKLGFLPGDLQNKVDPYLRPLYDALFDMMGAESFQRYMERGNIEVAPLAYMRGRTLDDSYIILDEAQNTTSGQMKMLLTRFGSNAKVVITGDVTQIDLPDPKASGLVEAVKVLRDVPDIGIVRLSGKDVIRHRLIQDIVKAYDQYYQSRPRSR